MHYDRVQNEKKILSENIVMLKEFHEQNKERIEEINKKYEVTMKEKTLLKLERDKFYTKVENTEKQIKEYSLLRKERTHIMHI
jgi:hypothetical protein